MYCKQEVQNIFERLLDLYSNEPLRARNSLPKAWESYCRILGHGEWLIRIRKGCEKQGIAWFIQCSIARRCKYECCQVLLVSYLSTYCLYFPSLESLFSVSTWSCSLLWVSEVEFAFAPLLLWPLDCRLLVFGELSLLCWVVLWSITLLLFEPLPP